MTGGFAIGPGGGAPLPAAGGALLAGAAETDGRFSLIRSHAPAGDRVPRHVHRWTDECFYVLDGDYHIECGDEAFDAGPGTFVYLPRGIAHGYTVGDLPASTLVLAAPGGLEDFFADLEAGTGAEEILHRHGIAMLP